MRQRTAQDAMFESDDLLPVLVEAVVRSVWLAFVTAWALLLFAFRNAAMAGIVAGLMIVGLREGWTTAALLIAGAAAVFVTWRVLHPASFTQVAAPRVQRVWRGAYYRARWQRVASRNGLVAYDANVGRQTHRHGEVPRIRKLVVTPQGVDRLSLRLPDGLTPSDVAARCAGIAHALGCRESRVVADRPGRVWLELHRRDALAAVIRPLPQASDVDLEAVPVGRHEDGTHWEVRLLGTHLLIAGATGAGKGSILWSLLHGLAPDISAGRVQVWAIDPKGGMELRPGLPLFSRFEDSDPESMCRMLEELVDLKDRRAQGLARHGLRKHAASVDSPHILAVIDELATLTAFAERSVVRRIDQALGLLLTQGRACGITVLAAVQDPGKDVVAWRDLFPTRIALRLDNPIQVDMVLGEGARDLGATADHISELTPGVAFVRTEGTRALRRVRSAYLTDEDIAGLTSSHRGHRALTLVDTHDSQGGEAA